MRIRSMVLVGLAAALGVLAASTPPVRAGGDDKDVKKAAALKKKRDDFRADQKKKGKMPFYDLSYAADPKAAGEPSRWAQTDPPPFQELSETKGGEFYATFSPDITKGTAIEIKAIKYIHKEGNSEFSMKFDSAGANPKCSDKNGMAAGFHKEARVKLKEVLKETEPKKTSVGPAELFSSLTGVNEEGKKTRKDFYIWMAPNTTWLLEVEYNEKYISDADFVVKAEEFIKTMKELKAPD